MFTGQVKCRGTENELADCDRGLFQDRLWCYGVNTVAGVICYNSRKYIESDVYLTSHLLHKSSEWPEDITLSNIVFST